MDLAILWHQIIQQVLVLVLVKTALLAFKPEKTFIRAVAKKTQTISVKAFGDIKVL